MRDFRAHIVAVFLDSAHHHDFPPAVKSRCFEWDAYRDTVLGVCLTDDAVGRERRRKARKLLTSDLTSDRIALYIPGRVGEADFQILGEETFVGFASWPGRRLRHASLVRLVLSGR